MKTKQPDEPVFASGDGKNAKDMLTLVLASPIVEHQMLDLAISIMAEAGVSHRGLQRVVHIVQDSIEYEWETNLDMG